MPKPKKRRRSTSPSSSSSTTKHHPSKRPHLSSSSSSTLFIPQNQIHTSFSTIQSSRSSNTFRTYYFSLSSSSSSESFSVGDVIAVDCPSSSPPPEGSNNNNKNAWFPFEVPWSPCQILSIYRTVHDKKEEEEEEEEEIFMEIRWFYRLADLPILPNKKRKKPKHQQQQHPEKEEEKEKVWETDHIDHISASSILGRVYIHQDGETKCKTKKRMCVEYQRVEYFFSTKKQKFQHLESVNEEVASVLHEEEEEEEEEEENVLIQRWKRGVRYSKSISIHPGLYLDTLDALLLHHHHQQQQLQQEGGQEEAIYNDFELLQNTTNNNNNNNNSDNDSLFSDIEMTQEEQKIITSTDDDDDNENEEECSSEEEEEDASRFSQAQQQTYRAKPSFVNAADWKDDGSTFLTSSLSVSQEEQVASPPAATTTLPKTRACHEEEEYFQTSKSPKSTTSTPKKTTPPPTPLFLYKSPQTQKTYYATLSLPQPPRTTFSTHKIPKRPNKTWTVSIGDTLCVLSPNATPPHSQDLTRFKHRKNGAELWFPFAQPWRPCQLLSLYSTNFTAKKKIKAEVRWLYRRTDIEPEAQEDQQRKSKSDVSMFGRGIEKRKRGVLEEVYETEEVSVVVGLEDLVGRVLLCFGPEQNDDDEEEEKEEKEEEIVPTVHYLCHSHYSIYERHIVPLPLERKYYLKRGVLYSNIIAKDVKLKQKVLQYLGLSGGDTTTTTTTTKTKTKTREIQFVQEEEKECKMEIIPPWSSYVHGSIIHPVDDNDDDDDAPNTWTVKVGDVVAVDCPGSGTPYMHHHHSSQKQPPQQHQKFHKWYPYKASWSVCQILSVNSATRTMSVRWLYRLSDYTEKEILKYKLNYSSKLLQNLNRMMEQVVWTNEVEENVECGCILGPVLVLSKEEALEVGRRMIATTATMNTTRKERSSSNSLLYWVNVWCEKKKGHKISEFNAKKMVRREKEVEKELKVLMEGGVSLSLLGSVVKKVGGIGGGTPGKKGGYNHNKLVGRPRKGVENGKDALIVDCNGGGGGDDTLESVSDNSSVVIIHHQSDFENDKDERHTTKNKKNTNKSCTRTPKPRGRPPKEKQDGQQQQQQQQQQHHTARNKDAKMSGSSSPKPRGRPPKTKTKTKTSPLKKTTSKPPPTAPTVQISSPWSSFASPPPPPNFQTPQQQQQQQQQHHDENTTTTTTKNNKNFNWNIQVGDVVAVNCPESPLPHNSPYFQKHYKNNAWYPCNSTLRWSICQITKLLLDDDDDDDAKTRIKRVKIRWLYRVSDFKKDGVLKEKLLKELKKKEEEEEKKSLDHLEQVVLTNHAGEIECKSILGPVLVLSKEEAVEVDDDCQMLVTATGTSGCGFLPWVIVWCDKRMLQGQKRSFFREVDARRVFNRSDDVLSELDLCKRKKKKKKKKKTITATTTTNTTLEKRDENNSKGTSPKTIPTTTTSTKNKPTEPTEKRIRTTTSPFHVDVSSKRSYYTKMQVLPPYDAYADYTEDQIKKYKKDNKKQRWTVSLGDTVVAEWSHRDDDLSGEKRYPFATQWSPCEIVSIWKKHSCKDEVLKLQENLSFKNRSNNSNTNDKDTEQVSVNDTENDTIMMEVRWMYEKHDIPGAAKMQQPSQNDEADTTTTTTTLEEVFETDHIDECSASSLLAPIKIHSEMTARITKPSSFDLHLGMPVKHFYCQRFWSYHRKSLVPIGSIQKRIDRGRLYSSHLGKDGVLKAALTKCMAAQNTERTSLTASSSHWKDAFHDAIKILSLCDASADASARGLALPGRDGEYQQISTFLRTAICGVGSAASVCKSGEELSVNSALFVAGPPGTGKTATVRSVVTSLRREQAKGEIPEFDFIPLNGMELRHPFDAYVKFWEAISGTRKEKRSPGTAAAMLERHFGGGGGDAKDDDDDRTPRKKRPVTVLLLDEIDYLVTKKQTVLYNLFDWPMRAATCESKGRLVVVGISNTINMPERLKPSIQSRLGGKRCIFQAYNKEDAKKILEVKLKPAPIFEDDAIEFAARKTAVNSGDIRRAFQMCKAAAERVMAEAEYRKGFSRSSTLRPTVQISDIQKASRELFNPIIARAVSCATSLEALMIVSLASLQRQSGREMGGFEIDELLSKMEGSARSLGDLQYLPPPSFAETLDILNRLGEAGVVQLETPKSYSVGGSTWPLVTLPMDCYEVEAALRGTRHSRLAEKFCAQQTLF